MSSGFRWIFFSFSVFVFLFFPLKSSFAQTVPYGSSSLTVQDSIDLTNDASGVARAVMISGSIELTPDRVVQRYINYGDGSGWVTIGGTTLPPGDVDNISATHQFAEAKDYTVGVAWIYKDYYDSANPIKILTRKECLRVFGTREVRSFGIKRLTYTGSQVTDSVTITAGDPNAYLGPFFGGGLSGNNVGAAPNTPWSWSWSTYSDGYYYGGVGNWTEPGNAFGSSNYHYYAANLVQSATLNLSSAIFASGGIGSWADYNFNNIIVYSRPNQKNPDGTCGSIPDLVVPTVTGAATPTPTVPVPTPTITCPSFTDKYCGTNQIIVFWNAVAGASGYKIYRNDTYLNWDSNFTSFTDTNAPCSFSYSYDVKPHYAGQPERDCQQNYPVSCACGATLAPSPTTAISSPTPTPTTGACVSACPSSPQKPIIPADLGAINSLPYTLSWTAPSSWGTVCSGIQNNHYHLYVSTTGVGASGTLKDSTGLFINGIDVAVNSYLLSSSLTEGQNYYWQVYAVNQ